MLIFLLCPSHGSPGTIGIPLRKASCAAVQASWDIRRFVASTGPYEFIKRRIVGHAKDIELDKQGRMLVPPELRDAAQLEQRIAIVGQINKLEIWSEPLYREAMAPEQVSSEDLEAALAEVSL